MSVFLSIPRGDKALQDLVQQDQTAVKVRQNIFSSLFQNVGEGSIMDILGRVYLLQLPGKTSKRVLGI